MHLYYPAPVIPFAMPASNKKEIQSNFQTYENKPQGFSIQFPKDWIWNEQGNGQSPLVTFMQPHSTDGFKSNVNVMVQNLPQKLQTLEAYSQFSVAQIQQSNNYNSFLESKPIMLHGKYAYQVLYNGNNDAAGFPSNVRFLQVWLVENAKAYLITYTAELNQFKNNFSIAKKMVQSFKLK